MARLRWLGLGGFFSVGMLTVFPSFSVTPPVFDFAQGLGQVLRFEPSPTYSGDTVGYDAQGRVVFLAQPEATWVMAKSTSW